MTLAAALPNKSTAGLMKRLMGTYLRPYWRDVRMALVFMLGFAASTAGLAQLMQPVLDKVLNETGDPAMIVPFGILLFCTFLARGLSAYLSSIIMVKIGQSIVADIQKDLFTHFLRLDLAFFHANPSGQLVSRVISDVQAVRAAVSDSLVGVGRSLLTLVGLVGVMFYQDWKLSLAAFVIFPVAATMVVYIGRRLRQISKSTQQELGNLNALLSQIFQGIRQVKAYGAEKHEILRSGRVMDTVKKHTIKSVRVGQLSTPFNDALAGLVISGIIMYGGYRIHAGLMSVGQLVSFLTAFSLAYEPMKKLASLNNVLQIGLGAAERIFTMMDTKPAIKDKSRAKKLSVKKPGVVFKEAVFQYEGAEDQALNGISFTAKPGKVTALVGPSGGGKTTIINLIPRFYDVQGGCVEVGGCDVRDIKLADLRRHISLVSQDIMMFDDTIAANIAYGKPGTDRAAIVKAAQLAAADEFISLFPEGYDTQVGENGVKLSGGQRQRIAIARALLHDAPILLLDEATSALDNESEKMVQKALKRLEKGRTTIVIAHRLSTVQEADQIIVLDKGAIAECGTHEQLMKAGGLYAKMYKAGFKD